jgi:hypothetical protein
VLCLSIQTQRQAMYGIWGKLKLFCLKFLYEKVANSLNIEHRIQNSHKSKIICGIK